MDNKLEVFGVTGTYGAGKGTVVDILKTKGFTHLSVSDYLMEKVKEAEWPENRDSLIKMGNELREKFGPGYLAEQLYDRALGIGVGKVIIESIRTEGEINVLRNKGQFILLGVDADRRLRYDRAMARNSIKDGVTFEEFCKSEDNEMTSTDPNKQNLERCIELSDYIILNNGTLDELQIRVNNIINNS